jgi:predicted ArsR family transcriptional regulator
MKTTVYFSEFCDYFHKIRPDNFSYQGLRILFDYLERMEEDIGEDMELDVVSICCEFSEDTWRQIADQYELKLENYESDEEKQEAVADYLSDQGVYVGEAGECIIYRQF